MIAAGERLRAAREQRSLTVEDIAATLRIPVRYVQALEAGDATVLPEPTFVRGYLRGYARAVGLDADELSAALAPVELRAPRPLVGIEGTQIRAGARKRGGWSLPRPGKRTLVVALLLVAGVAAWQLLPSGPAEPVPDATVALPADSLTVEVPLPVAPAAELPLPAADGAAMPVALPLPATPDALPAAPASAAPTAAPATPVAASAPATPVAASAAALQPAATDAAPKKQAAVPGKGLVVRFSGACWIEVRDVDNNILHTSLGQAGAELKLDGLDARAPLTVTLGDSSRAQVWWNGSSVVVDRFTRAGVARVIVGQVTR